MLFSDATGRLTHPLRRLVRLLVLAFAPVIFFVCAYRGAEAGVGLEILGAVVATSLWHWHTN